MCFLPCEDQNRCVCIAGNTESDCQIKTEGSTNYKQVTIFHYGGANGKEDI